MILLAHITVVDPVSRLPEVLYFTSGRSYTYVNRTYLPLLSRAVDYSQNLFSRGTTKGEVTVGIGNIELENSSGLLDYLRTYGLGGHPLEIYVLEDENEIPTEQNLYFRGVSFYAQLDHSKMVMYVMSNLQQIDKPCTEATFAGDNEGFTGLEGSEAIKDKLKPMVFGRVRNIQPYPVNAAALIFGCNYDREGNRKPVKDISIVRDKGGEILFEADVATAADLQAATVLPGHYKSCVAEGLIKLGTVNRGTVTMDVIESNGIQSTAASVTARMLEDLADFVPGQHFDTGSLVDLDMKNSAPVGIYITTSQTILSAVAEVLNSIGAWAVPDSRGVIYFGRIESPAGKTPIATVTHHQWSRNSFNRVPVADQARNIPAYKLALSYGRNWSPMSKGELLPSLSTATATELKEEYLTSNAEDVSVKTVHPQAVFLEVETLLSNQLDGGVRNGDCNSNEGGEWQLLDPDFGVTAPTLTFDGNMHYSADTAAGSSAAESGAFQTVGRGQIASGTYIVEYTLISGNVSIDVVNSGGTVLGADPAPVDEFATVLQRDYGTHSFSFTYDRELHGNEIKLRFYCPQTWAFFQLATISVKETAQGLTPMEEAQRRLSIYSKIEERYTFEVDFSEFKHVTVGSAIEVQSNRFGLEAGKNFMVIGRTDDLLKESIELDVWSPNEY